MLKTRSALFVCARLPVSALTPTRNISWGRRAAWAQQPLLRITSICLLGCLRRPHRTFTHSCLLSCWRSSSPIAIFISSADHRRLTVALSYQRIGSALAGASIPLGSLISSMTFTHHVQRVIAGKRATKSRSDSPLAVMSGTYRDSLCRSCYESRLDPLS